MSSCLKVKGPVFPLPTPFNEDESLDLPGLERYVDFLIKAGAETLMVTVGTSRFGLLTVDEMLAVNETAVRAAGDRAAVIVTTPASGPLSQALEFVRHAAAIKAAGILAVYPDRFYREDDVYDWFRALSGAAELPVFIHLAPIPPGRPGLGPVPSLALMKRLAALDQVCGMKEESNAPAMIYAYNRHLPKDFSIIGGAGGMRAYLGARQWGQPAYLVGIGNFVPQVELAFYQAMDRGDLVAAQSLVFEKEEPFFEAAVGLGWHVALKDAMSQLGLMQPWERAPMARLTPAESDRLKTCMPEG